LRRIQQWLSAISSIGYGLSLSGPLASNGKTARLAHQIWESDVNRRGGLRGRSVQMICVDDQTNLAAEEPKWDSNGYRITPPH
jgi:ABC-type branched-subunit amino acid transport system substrate-binding protein